ncbi:MAG: magnesium/cobalt transporter CorA [Candidatus Omnitrophica bacterium]|nr:magnesium/cobalt transporter CorA [Candidatus Omnitrophota bacterium]
MGKIIKKSKSVGQPPGTLIYEGKIRPEDVKITIFDYSENEFQEKTVKSAEECVPFKNKPTVTWINIDGIHRIDILQQLSQSYGLHHLVLEDILNINQRPKIEDMETYIYLCAKMLSYDEKTKEISEEQVSILFGSNFLITFQEEKPGDVFDITRERIRNNKGKIRKMGPDYLAYALLDAIVDNYFIIMENISERVESLEEELVENPVPTTLHQLNGLKRNIIFLRKSIWPLREVLSGITRSGSTLIQENTLIYFNNVYDHTIQVIDTIEAFRDIVSGMLDIYLSSLSNRLNQIMKVLTVIATIFMPLTFIAGIYGMNFNTSASSINMPELNWRFGYIFALSLMALTALGMLSYFKKKNWF